MAGAMAPTLPDDGVAAIQAEADAAQGAPGGGTDARSWPSAGAAWFALFAIVLATFLNFFDQTVFGMLAQRIKLDFGLSDEQLGFLGGPASVIFFVVVGIPLARLADVYPRRLVLAGGMLATGTIMALGGLAQGFGQFVGTRMFLGAGGSAHAPASYSLLADFFPPRKITRAFAVLQLGFIGGTTVGVALGGKLIVWLAGVSDPVVLGLHVHSWQLILLGQAALGLVAALLLLAIREPARRGLAPAASRGADLERPGLGRRILAFTGLDAMRAIHARGRVYYPLFLGLALAAVETFGLAFWRVPFMIRTYGWDEGRIGMVMAPMLLVSSLLGVFLGGVFVEWMAKRHKDANVRCAAILFGLVTVCAIVSPLMPTGETSLAVMALSGMFGLAGAVPQNAAIQRIAPNEMRGQVTAIYLFMFTFFGAMGSFVVGVVAQRIVGVEAQLWKALVITAAALLPIATISMILAIRPYREEVARLEAQGR
ncbi:MULTISPECIES: MFS transporter [unclassified Novosphingobium]|uniref:MFS transporter n=1 Tax=Novosphingobium TaxID=165696 RepID=UPI0017D86949|nr:MULTISPECIES: MFS transporter [unclassified Novosphingobium]NKJ43437.1 MFS family permease [Novosphingobium sp. SG720]NMN06869.1 MFS family permease [Novosphingobium sp. SG919]NMN89544.1 MFS family permease [Novosphingobium sp. SG916]